MNRKHPPDNTQQKVQPRTRRETALKVTLSALVCLWMFILGILVGRGSAPVRFDIQRLQDELAALKAATVEETIKRYRVAFEEVDKQVDLGFHEALKDPKTDLSATALSLPDPPVSKGPATPDILSEKTESNLLKKARSPEFQKKTKAEVPEPWVIQVAATQDKMYGNQLTENLKKMGFRAYLTSAEVSGKGTWYRIRVGGYADRSGAEADFERLKKELKKERFSPMIITP